MRSTWGRSTLLHVDYLLDKSIQFLNLTLGMILVDLCTCKEFVDIPVSCRSCTSPVKLCPNFYLSKMMWQLHMYMNWPSIVELIGRQYTMTWYTVLVDPVKIVLIIISGSWSCKNWSFVRPIVVNELKGLTTKIDTCKVKQPEGNSGH